MSSVSESTLTFSTVTFTEEGGGGGRLNSTNTSQQLLLLRLSGGLGARCLLLFKLRVTVSTVSSVLTAGPLTWLGGAGPLTWPGATGPLICPGAAGPLQTTSSTSLRFTLLSSLGGPLDNSFGSLFLRSLLVCLWSLSSLCLWSLGSLFLGSLCLWLLVFTLALLLIGSGG